MRNLRAVWFGVCLFLGAAVLATHADTIFQSPPVTSVNAAQGDVIVPTVQRQVSPPLDISSGTATWNFPNTFTNMPTCWISISTSNASYVYSAPVTTAISQTAVTISLTAALKLVTISLGGLTLWATPPTGTTATLSCVGALP